MSETVELLQLVKDNNEIVIMIVGIFLIIIGIIIFITGRYSNNENHVEGFGIKMDVKNPSLILIVFGVFLLVFPMMNPKEKEVSTPPAKIEVQPIEKPKDKVVSKPIIKIKEEMKPTAKLVSKPKVKQKIQSFSIKGEYSLSTYVEDNIPYNITGQLQIEKLKHNKYAYNVQYQLMDQWNNRMSITFAGYFIKRGDQWYLKVNASNDPEWRDIGEVPTELIYDKSSRMLGLQYHYDAQVASIWNKMR
ncbi:MAG: hypothetical protein DRG78_18690 [Epsilonproteobacteria bacterium]|nr:MAG: hypothetical protein DRG78_18690 [Campylobacterota bacterium]